MPGPLRPPRLNPSRHVSCTNPCTNQVPEPRAPACQHGRGHGEVMRGRTVDLPLMRPDIFPVATDRASYLRCRRSLPLAVGRCCSCHRCCQLGAGRPIACRPVPCRGWPASGPGRPPGLAPGSDRSVPIRSPGSSVTSRVRSPGTFTCARCPAVTVTLGAGGADTYTQRAIPGSHSDIIRSMSWVVLAPVKRSLQTVDLPDRPGPGAAVIRERRGGHRD
jgi:hypothetical protein